MKRSLHNRKDLALFRVELRRNLTPAEAWLWTNLKNSQLDGKKFRRQHGIGPYIADFYCPECRVIVELDGAAHQGVLAGERDAARDQYLTNLGINVLRFENRAVFDNLEFVLETIRAALKSSPPQPRRHLSC